eukprot:m.885605 g.885605  ORF g.885605 m.885605 type:complete len:71 (-) comp23622_c0_seq7:2041-2253(-)
MPTTGTNTVARTGLLWHLVSDGQCANCYYADVVEKINGRLGTGESFGTTTKFAYNRDQQNIPFISARRRA